MGVIHGCRLFARQIIDQGRAFTPDRMAQAIVEAVEKTVPWYR